MSAVGNVDDYPETKIVINPKNADLHHTKDGKYSSGKVKYLRGRCTDDKTHTVCGCPRMRHVLISGG